MDSEVPYWCDILPYLSSPEENEDIQLEINTDTCNDIIKNNEIILKICENNPDYSTGLYATQDVRNIATVLLTFPQFINPIKQHIKRHSHNYTLMNSTINVFKN